MKSSLRIIFVLYALADIAYCQRPQTTAIVADKATLKGHAAMAVTIEMGSLPGANLRPDIEDRLREGGIAILRQTDDPRTYPLLLVGLGGTTVQRLQQLNYHVTLEFLQLFPYGDGTY